MRKTCAACPRRALRLDYVCPRHSKLAAKNIKAYVQQQREWQRRLSAGKLVELARAIGILS